MYVRNSLRVCGPLRAPSTCAPACTLKRSSYLFQSCVHLHVHHVDDADDCRAGNQHDLRDALQRARNLCRVYGRVRYVKYKAYFFLRSPQLIYFYPGWLNKSITNVRHSKLAARTVFI